MQKGAWSLATSLTRRRLPTWRRVLGCRLVLSLSSGSTLAAKGGALCRSATLTKLCQETVHRGEVA